jgi:hypothetical protein
LILLPKLASHLDPETPKTIQNEPKIRLATASLPRDLPRGSSNLLAFFGISGHGRLTYSRGKRFARRFTLPDPIHYLAKSFAANDFRVFLDELERGMRELLLHLARAGALVEHVRGEGVPSDGSASPAPTCFL